jgi:hypothetical protein
MPFRLIPPAIFLLPLLGCSAPSPPAIEAPPVPAAMIRPACSPPASLMQAPGPLAALPAHLSEAAALAAWLDDMRAYQELRGQAGALQTFIRQSCQ